jgi:translation initiation factor IF-2
MAVNVKRPGGRSIDEPDANRTSTSTNAAAGGQRTGGGGGGGQRSGGGGGQRSGGGGGQRSGGGGGQRSGGGGGGGQRGGQRSGGGGGQRSGGGGGQRSGGDFGRGGQGPNRSPARSPQVARPPVRPRGPIELPSVMTVRELSEAMGIGASDIIKGLMKGGVMVNINQQIDYDTAAVIAADFGIETKEYVPAELAGIVTSIDEVMAAQPAADLRPRPPVVTIMGHVDHGKTKLLDSIRLTRVAEGEAGGITQHIGAYQVEVHGKRITFLDTPGHEAFTAMRARGAQATDIVILVVAADDGVMPQTIEAIDHVRAAGVPMIVAINKIDAPGANADRVRTQLAEHGVVIEAYGGDVPAVEVSAKMKLNIDGLLEMVLLVAELEDLKANPDTLAVGTIVEAELDKNRGPIATVLIQNGTLHQDDIVLVGGVSGKIKAMFNDQGKRLRSAEPAMPVEILGLEEVPQAGDILQAMNDITLAREVATQRQRQHRAETIAKASVSLDDLFSKIQQGQVKDLNIILKGDVQGSLGAIEHTLGQLNQELTEVDLKIIRQGTGTITESDVNLATASNAIIIGFNARPDPAARRAAEQHNVDIRFYNIIYNLTEDIKKAMVGMLAPEYREAIDGFAEVRNSFRLPSREVVAGLYVTDGKINRNLSVRVLRNGVVIHDGRIGSLKRFKDDVREVASGYECGLVVDGFSDIQVGDTTEFYHKEKVERTV